MNQDTQRAPARMTDEDVAWQAYNDMAERVWATSSAGPQRDPDEDSFGLE